MAPAGETQFKGRTTAQEVGFAVKVQKPAAGGASVILNGRPV